MHARTPSKCINEALCWERSEHFNRPSFGFGIMSWYAACDKEYGTAGLEVPNDDVFTGVQLCFRKSYTSINLWYASAVKCRDTYHPTGTL